MITKYKNDYPNILLINLEVMDYAASKDILSALNRLESIFETSYNKVFQLTVYLKVSLYLKITFFNFIILVRYIIWSYKKSRQTRINYSIWKFKIGNHKGIENIWNKFKRLYSTYWKRKFWEYTKIYKRKNKSEYY